MRYREITDEEALKILYDLDYKGPNPPLNAGIETVKNLGWCDIPFNAKFVKVERQYGWSITTSWYEMHVSGNELLDSGDIKKIQYFIFND